MNTDTPLTDAAIKERQRRIWTAKDSNPFTRAVDEVFARNLERVAKQLADALEYAKKRCIKHDIPDAALAAWEKLKGEA